MPTPKDLTGQRFGRLVVVSLYSKTQWRERPIRNRQWLCQCDCGNQTIVDRTALGAGTTKSCGCLKLEGKHGQTTNGRTTGTYRSWLSMIQRCTNPNYPRWKDYGGRGIQVCERWFTAANFIADMGPRPDGWSIERINNDGNYEPKNCKWIPRPDQAKNRRPAPPFTAEHKANISAAAKRRHLPRP